MSMSADHDFASADDRAPVGALAVVAVSAFGIASGMTVVATTMPAILGLGGFVARGGPYAIAHPAPNWSWIIPVAFATMIASILVNFWTAGRIGRISLILPAWSALFFWTGYHFLAAGLHPPADVEDASAWTVCGIVFFVMAALGVLGLLFARRLPFPYGTSRVTAAPGFVPMQPRVGVGVYVAVNAAAIALGGIVGVLVVRAAGG